MKPIIYVFILLFASPVFAASTCEQRVDKNLAKSTPEKVSLCLTPEADLPLPQDATRVIYYNAVSAVPAEKEALSESNEPPKIYQPEVVSREYVEKKHFPPFANDIPSSADEKAAAAAAKNAVAAGRVKTDSVRSEAKPARKVKTNLKPKAVKKDAMLRTPSVLAEPTDTTPLSELVRAQALKNDPIAQNYTDGGAAPAGFVQDDLVIGESFGYNNTDPAFQP